MSHMDPKFNQDFPQPLNRFFYYDMLGICRFCNVIVQRAFEPHDNLQKFSRFEPLSSKIDTIFTGELSSHFKAAYR